METPYYSTNKYLTEEEALKIVASGMLDDSIVVLPKRQIEAMRKTKAEDIMLVTFFNQGDHLVYQFNPRPERGDSFYWFYDRFYSHFSINNQDRYIHIFIRYIDPKSPYFWFMQGIQSWKEAVKYFTEIKTAKDNNIPCGDPPILRSNEVLIPDLILDFQTPGSKEAIVIHPAEHQGVKCQIFDDSHTPIRFDAIPEITAILPQIKDSLPFKVNTSK